MAVANPPQFPDLREFKIWDVSRVTNSQEYSIAWCQENGLIRGTPVCNHCRDEMGIKLTYKGDQENFRFRCNHKNCRAEIPVRRDSFFEGSHLPISTIVRFSYLWAHDYPQHSQYQFQYHSYSRAISPSLIWLILFLIP